MNKAIKTFALSAISVALLSGCILDDKYDGGSTGGGGGDGADSVLGRAVPLYYTGNHEDDLQPYVMTAIDSAGADFQVTGEEIPNLENIQVIGDFLDTKPLTVTISEDKASLVFKANKKYDMNTSNVSADGLGGSVQFYVTTTNYEIGDGEERNKVMLTMGSGDIRTAIDISSAMAAATPVKDEDGASVAQFMRVPLNCFVEQGLDLDGVDFAMGIESEGAIQYEFSQARIIANSVADQPGAQNFQGCRNNNNSLILIDDEAVLYRDERIDGEWSASGLTEDVRLTRGSSINVTAEGTDEGAQRYRGIHYDDKFESHRRSVFTFAIDRASELQDMSQPRLDISHYMEKGALQMNLIIPNSSEVPEGDIKLVMTLDTPSNNTNGIVNGGYPSSEEVVYNLTANGVEKGTIHPISIPVRDFYTKPNGSISLNGLQYVEKLTTHIEQTDADGEADFSKLKDFRYAFGDIKFVLDAEEQVESN